MKFNPNITFYIISNLFLFFFIPSVRKNMEKNILVILHNFISSISIQIIGKICNLNFLSITFIDLYSTNSLKDNDIFIITCIICNCCT